jgi:hypothetical protein
MKGAKTHVILSGLPELDKLTHELHDIRRSSNLFLGRLVIFHKTKLIPQAFKSTAMH